VSHDNLQRGRLEKSCAQRPLDGVGHALPAFDRTKKWAFGVVCLVQTICSLHKKPSPFYSPTLINYANEGRTHGRTKIALSSSTQIKSGLKGRKASLKEWRQAKFHSRICISFAYYANQVERLRIILTFQSDKCQDLDAKCEIWPQTEVDWWKRGHVLPVACAHWLLLTWP
jgi:hypothetical protein